MSEEEEGFLRAISSDPHDWAARLIYADWLEEKGDCRGELLRLQACLRDLPPTDPDYSKWLVREQQLRQQCPPYWLALIDPPVWCVVGNIVPERPFGPAGAELRRGTRLFRPNAKIYLAARRHGYALLNPQLWGDESILVVGQHRKSRKWISCWVRMSCTTNWRVRPTRHPGASVRLREMGWEGFCLRLAEFSCTEERTSPVAIEALFNAIDASVARQSRFETGGGGSPTS